MVRKTKPKYTVKQVFKYLISEHTELVRDILQIYLHDSDSKVKYIPKDNLSLSELWVCVTQRNYKYVILESLLL